MAKKSKKVNKKKWQQTVAIVISVLVVVGLVATSLIGFFGGGLASLNPREPETDIDPEQEIAYLQDRVEALEDFIQDNPDSLAAWTELGNSYFDMGSYASFLGDNDQVKEYFFNALEPYAKALELDPDNVGIAVDRATAAFYAGEKEMAEEAFQAAIALDPEYSPAYFNYGMFLMNTGDLEDAIAQFTKVQELEEEDTSLYINAGVMIAQLEAFLADEEDNSNEDQGQEGEEESSDSDNQE